MPLSQIDDDLDFNSLKLNEKLKNIYDQSYKTKGYMADLKGIIKMFIKESEERFKSMDKSIKELNERIIRLTAGEDLPE